MFSYKHNIVQDDLSDICAKDLDWNHYDGKSVLVTGVNGMLASYIMFVFIYLVKHKGLHVDIVALTRSLDKTRTIYGTLLDEPFIHVLVQDVSEPIQYDGHVDEIFHLAGNASPYSINHEPVGILRANLLGTFNMLEFARMKSVRRVLFVSTREVYGASTEKQLSETSFGSLDPLDNRSCYPESKRAAETVLRSYFLQYGIEIVIARVAHSYGPGMKIHNDGRVMADFIGNAVRGEDIVLRSSGEAVRAFLYLSDAVTGLFTMMLKGEAGEAYNLSNETEPLPIYQVAQLICQLSPNDIQVVFSADRPKEGYCNYPRVALDNSKIQRLGFIPKVKLSEGIVKTLNSYE